MLQNGNNIECIFDALSAHKLLVQRQKFGPWFLKWPGIRIKSGHKCVMPGAWCRVMAGQCVVVLSWSVRAREGEASGAMESLHHLGLLPTLDTQRWSGGDRIFLWQSFFFSECSQDTQRHWKVNLLIVPLDCLLTDWHHPSRLMIK